MSDLDNIVALSEARSKRGNPGAGDSDSRVVIRLNPGKMHEAVVAIDAVMSTADDGLYQQSGRLITLIVEDVILAGGERAVNMRMSLVTLPHLLERISRYCRFQVWSMQAGDWIDRDCPQDIGAAYLARDGRWKIRQILGYVNAPTIRADGSILDTVGYDPATCIVFNPLGKAFLPVPERPSREMALEALALLLQPLAGYPFDGPVRSVALSGIMTTVVRRALSTAPMHAFSASTAGSGKSMLVDIASIIATGRVASVTSTGRENYGDDELEKRLTSSMLAGDTVLSLDNMETPLSGQLLCQLLTQSSVKLRIFGKLLNIETPVTTSFFATGNNLIVAGDLTRRVLVGVFNVDAERPELREFDFNPLDMCRSKRAELIQGVLIMIRAYLGRGDDGFVPPPPLGSYELWSRFVRNTLIWLGLDDPVLVLDNVRENDPFLDKLKTMVFAWEGLFGDKDVMLSDAVMAAEEQWPNTEPGGAVWKNGDLREAMMGVAGVGRGISLERLGKWLTRNNERLVNGRKFVKVIGRRKATWQLVGADPVLEQGGGDSEGVGGLMGDDLPF